MDRDISPPPAKRVRLATDNGKATTTADILPPTSLSPLRPLSFRTALNNPTRIYSWNVNGIAPFIQPSIASFVNNKARVSKQPSTTPITTSLRNFLGRHQWPQILGLQEVKINPSDLATQRAVEVAVNRCRSGPDGGPQYRVFFSLPRDEYNARGFGRKVYGVATIIRTDFMQEEEATVREVDWDLEGRILVVETNKSKLSIWNIYAVNGTTNAYRDPLTGTVTGTRHDRKLAFHKLLLDEAKRLEQRGYRVVLAGDMNIAPTTIDGIPNLRTKPQQHVINRADFNEKFFDGIDGLRGVDSFRHLHPQQKKYTYHPRNVQWRTSCDRVDLIVVSRALVDLGALIEADILESPGERGPSDHCPHFISLDLEILKSGDGDIIKA